MTDQVVIDAQPPAAVPPGWGPFLSFLGAIPAIAGIAAYAVLVGYSASATTDVWQPTTVAYDPACTVNCEPFRYLTLGHQMSAADAVAVPRAVFNPSVDDPIAQWGDCLETIISCVRAQPRNVARNVNGCVRLSSCPWRCIRRYLTMTGPTIERAERALFSVFIDRTAVCRPVEPLP